MGHWLQKSTEHVMGCVLCSPGCFSLFRAEALMTKNVMKTYTTKSTEPFHYVQYDQGKETEKDVSGKNIFDSNFFQELLPSIKMKLPLYHQRAILFLFSINCPGLQQVYDSFKGIFRPIILKYKKNQ